MIISFYIKEFISKEKSIIIKYIRNIYVIDNFKANFLIKINILGFKNNSN